MDLQGQQLSQPEQAKRPDNTNVVQDYNTGDSAKTPESETVGIEYVSNPFKVFLDSFAKFFNFNLVTLIGLVAVYVLPAMLLVVVFLVFQGRSADLESGMLLSEPVNGVTIAALLVGGILLLYWFSAFLASLQKYAIDTARRVNLTFKTAFKVGIKKAPGFLLLNLVVILAVLLGLLLLIVPGLIFLYWFVFAGVVYIDKDVSIGEALKESKRLVKGKLGELAGLFGTSLIFSIPASIPILGSIYNLILSPVSQIAWTYRYTSAEILDRSNQQKPPTHIANKIVIGLMLALPILIVLFGLAMFLDS